MSKLLVKIFNRGLLSNYCNLIVTRTLAGLKIPRMETEEITFHRYKKMDTPDGVFKGVIDRFNGITVDSKHESYNTEDAEESSFLRKLEKSLEFWKETKRRGIWFKVHGSNAEWVPHLAKKGFNFHHAKNGFVMMMKWLPEDESVNVPEYSHTMIGVGGVVINDKNEVLVVGERYSLIENSLKLPGGYVEPKENLIDAAIREVREETGVETRFETVVSFRHSHGGGYGCSDLYVVIGLKPITSQLIRCEREIAKVEWMPIDEYLTSPNVHETNRHFVRTFVYYKENGLKMDCESRTHKILQKPYKLYTFKHTNNKL